MFNCRKSAKNFDKKPPQISRQWFFIPNMYFSLLPCTLVQIFFLCGQTSANMPLRFVDVQYLSGLGRQCGVDLREAVGYVLMYGCH